jgi:SAM-dependent methyltransferase
MSAPGPCFTEFGPAYFERQYRNYRLQNPPRKLRFYQGLVERAAGGRPRPRILDLGCAFGLFLSILGDRWDRFGVDASERNRRSPALTPDVKFAVAGAGNVPFPTV